MGFVVNVELKSFLWHLNVMAGKKDFFGWIEWDFLAYS